MQRHGKHEGWCEWHLGMIFLNVFQAFWSESELSYDANTNTSPIWKITSQIDWIHWDLWDCLGDVTVCQSAISSFSGFISGPLGHPTPQKTAGTLKNTGIFCKRRLRTWKLIHFFSYPVILGSIHNVDLGDRRIGWLQGAKSKKKPGDIGGAMMEWSPGMMYFPTKRGANPRILPNHRVVRVRHWILSVFPCTSRAPPKPCCCSEVFCQTILKRHG